MSSSSFRRCVQVSNLQQAGTLALTATKVDGRLN